MSVPYDSFINEFFDKIVDRDLPELTPESLNSVLFGYLRRAVNSFKHICLYDLASSMDDENECFNIDIDPEDLPEIEDIVSEGMIVQWLKPYVYRQELLENVINTRDFTTYSPAELLMRVGNAYREARKDFTQMMREYSYNHGDLTELHI